MQRMERTQQIFKAVTSLDKTKATYIFPVMEMTKSEVWTMLPRELRETTWSCRRPVYDENRQPSPCGKCATCKDRNGVDTP